MLSKIYQQGLLLSGAAGSAYGLHSGTKAAFMNYNSSEDITFSEKIMETFCFATVIIGYTSLWSMIGVSTYIMSPIIVPYSVYKKLTNKKEIEVTKLVHKINNYGSDDTENRF